eukprot:CAMPEP_0113507904 /NCGR_PEP_ID=MMETSP0014_2-20120614/36716_1 /TAXON_ID=2857 /ORGANISM="Nitzschia sp." /LENGTH=52 /DNA_ID=CAMNT_0000403549 /DNA_START=41 /DNA_END=195 /DNA_ORIENTATION=+ /assembly_acc=CAM_ASM_000159
MPTDDNVDDSRTQEDTTTTNIERRVDSDGHCLADDKHDSRRSQSSSCNEQRR